MTFVFFILRVRAVLLIKSETISSQSEAFMTMELVSEATPPTHIPHISTTERWRFTEEQRCQTAVLQPGV